MDTVNAKQEAMPLKEINMDSQDNKGKFDFNIFRLSHIPYSPTLLTKFRKGHRARSSQNPRLIGCNGQILFRKRPPKENQGQDIGLHFNVRSKAN